MENQADLNRLSNQVSPERSGQKTKLSGVLNGFLTFILILMGIAMVLLFVGFIAIMINPQLETFNSYDDFRFLYEFSPVDLEQSFEVVESNSSL